MINESEVSLSVSEYRYEDLTTKQQKLITGLMAGLPKAEAYRQAYPDAKIANPTDQVNCMITNRNGNFRKFAVVYADMQAEAMKRIEAEKENAIASRTDIALFFTQVMSGAADGDATVSDRLRAGELLGKYYGMFRDKVDVAQAATVTIVDDMGADDE